MKHRETHAGLDVAGCFACRIAHFGVSGSATPTRGEIGEMNRKERLLGRDLDAYKRIRKSGGQPETIDGSAKFEAMVD
jgi:hypothetical protein